MKRYVAYIVGDENIEFGALVALHSFHKYNKNVDLKLYTYIDKMDLKIQTTLEHIGVELIDITQYLKEVELFEVHSDEGLQWPKETFVNYLIPSILKEEYEYCIKLDYDLFTMRKIDFEKIVPKNKLILSSVYNPFNLYKMMGKTFKFYRKNYYIGKKYCQKISTNTGFVIFNNAQYEKQDIFGKMKELYLEVKEKDEKVFEKIYADQGLLTLVLGVYSLPYKIIPNGYNVTTKIHKLLKEEDVIYNLHFTGSLKPWKVNEFDEDELIQNGYSNIYMSYYWLKYVNENLPEFSSYYRTNFDDMLLKITAETLRERNFFRHEYKKYSGIYHNSRYIAFRTASLKKVNYYKNKIKKLLRSR